jgi:hypothetical protein
MRTLRFRYLTLLLALLGPRSLFGQTCTNYVGSLSLSTGVNPTNGSLLPLGVPDPGWTVIEDPFPLTIEPRPADVFTNALSAWATIPGTHWIGSQYDANQGTNGDYYYQRCFCLRDGFGKANLQLSLRADDREDLYLNATLAQVKAHAVPPILQGAISSFMASKPPDTLPNPFSAGLKFGENCLIVHVQNTGGVATGFDAAGSISAAGPNGTGGLLAPECCQRTGSICGTKWNDLNHDGIHQPGEPGLQGWTVQLGNGQTATTDPFGNYCFTNLPPGPYTVAEQAQAGWTQMWPKNPPSYSVTVAAATATGAIDFGNWKGELGQLKLCKVAGVGVPVGTPITFTAGSSTVAVPAGPAPGGSCKLGPSFPVGTSVAVTETIPAGDTVSSIAVAPAAQLVGTPNLATGVVNVKIGSGVTEVTYTDTKSGYLEICKQGKTKGSFTFHVNPGNLGPFVVPAGACSPAIEVPAGTVTIDEVPSSAFVISGCATIPASRQGPCSGVASTVTVPAGDVSTQTIAIITNRPQIPIDLPEKPAQPDGRADRIEP